MKIKRLNENYPGSSTGGTRTYPDKLTPDKYDLQNRVGDDEISYEGDDDDVIDGIYILGDEVKKQFLMKEPNDEMKPGPNPKGP